MNVFNAVNLATGIGELTIAALILRETWHLGRGRPPLVWGIVMFFVIDAFVAINRSEVFWSRSEELYKATTLDIAALVVLMFVFMNARRLAQAAVATLDLAQYKADEYERARRDYTQVVRHRMMNPLTVVEGAAQTLKAGTALDEPTRQKLLDAVLESTAVLKQTTLEPERRDTLERDLDAVPKIDS